MRDARRPAGRASPAPSRAPWRAADCASPASISISSTASLSLIDRDERRPASRHVDERAIEQLARARAAHPCARGAVHGLLQRRELRHEAARRARERRERELDPYEQRERSLAPDQKIEQLAAPRVVGERVSGRLLPHARVRTHARRRREDRRMRAWRENARWRAARGAARRVERARASRRRTRSRAPSPTHASSRSAACARRQRSSPPCRRSCRTHRSTDPPGKRSLLPARALVHRAAQRARPDHHAPSLDSRSVRSQSSRLRSTITPAPTAPPAIPLPGAARDQRRVGSPPPSARAQRRRPHPPEPPPRPASRAQSPLPRRTPRARTRRRETRHEIHPASRWPHCLAHRPLTSHSRSRHHAAWRAKYRCETSDR